MQRQMVLPVNNWKLINKWLDQGYEVGYQLGDKLIVLNLIRVTNQLGEEPAFLERAVRGRL